MQMLEYLFWFSLFGSAYSYLVYPLLLMAVTPLASRRTSTLRRATTGPVSVIITARNEAPRIAGKVRQTLDLMPPGTGEVIVVSDASTDGTDAEVTAMADPRVRLVRQDQRLGKEAGQRKGIEAATGDILIFSDVSTQIGEHSIAALQRCFADPTVGAVSSEDCFVTADGAVAGEGLYVRYEMWLRRLESRLAGLVGLSGSFFAVRRHLCTEWHNDVPSDFMVALTCARHGLRATSDRDVLGIYADLKEPADEYARKRRTVLRGMAGLAAALEVLNPLRYGWFALQVWSHKVMRWAVPWFLLLCFVTTVALAVESLFFAVLMAAASLGIGLLVLAWRFPALRRARALRIPYYFMLVNVSMADALVRFVGGERIVTWEPSRR